MATTSRLVITEMVVGQSGGENLFNTALRTLDANINLTAIRQSNTPVGGETGGEVYLVGTSGSGDFNGEDNKIAYYDNGFKFIVADEGMTCYLQNTNVFVKFDGSTWIGGATVADLNQNISAAYVEAEVQAISDKVDVILVELRKQGVITE